MIDLLAELVAALKSTSGKEAIGEAVRPVVLEVLRRVLDEREEKLVPLSRILNVKTDTARKKIKRDPSLEALGVQVGRRVLFKPSTVLAHLAANGRGT